MARDNEKSTKGKITKLKLDQEFESKAGKEYTAHVLIIEDEEGESHKFIVNTKIKAAEFVAKLKVGDKVSVKTGGEYNSVQAVFKDGFEKKEFKGRGGYERKPHDATGAIQGMVLKAAIDIAIARDKVSDPENIVNNIVESAKAVLLAKLKIDKLVVQALKPKEDEDDADEDRETSSKKAIRQNDEDSDESEDEEESSKKSKKKSSPY